MSGICSSQQNAGLLNSRKGEEQISPMPSLTGFLITFCIGVAATLVSVSKLLESRESVGFKGGDLIRGGVTDVDA